MARYPAAHRVEMRERILRAAADLFRGGGYGATGVDKVMAAVGKTAGGFYAYFQSKESLLAETIHVAMTESRRLLVDDTPQEPEAKLSVWLRRYLSRQHRDLAERGCPLPALLPEVARSGPEPRKALQLEIDGFSSEISEMLSTIGSSQAHPDPKVLGDALVALSVGAIALARVAPDRERSDAILLHARHAAEALSGVAVVHARSSQPNAGVRGDDGE